MTTATTVGVTTFSTPSDRVILIERSFDAPRDLVWEALSKPEHMLQWFHPRGTRMTTCTADLEVGGKWRWVFTNPDGSEMGMYGEYREVDPPARVVSTESFDDFPGEAVNTITLTEDGDGRTRFSCVAEYESQEIRDMVLASGMSEGAAESYDLLNEYLQTL